MSAKTNDSLFLAIGGLAVVGAGVWAFVQQSSISQFSVAPQAPASGVAYEPSAIQVSTPESQTWAVAPSQKAGEKWIYDVFTPPKIYYNTQTKTFVVEPPVFQPLDPEKPVVEVPADSFPALVKVEQPLFRLQLVGYVGEGASARGNFLNVKTGSVAFGTTGKKLPELNLEVVKFSAERRRTPVAGGTVIVETVVTAVVRDTETGVETALDSKARTPEGPLLVTIKLPDGTERTAKSGEVILAGDFSYKIGDLTLEPPSVVITKEGGGVAPETKTVVIPPPPPPPPPVDPNAPPPESMPGAPGAFPGF